MKIYHFNKNIKRDCLVYPVFAENSSKNYQFYRLKGAFPQFHLKNSKGEVFCSIVPGVIRKNSIMIYFSRFAIEVRRKLEEYSVVYHRKHRDIFIEGGTRSTCLLLLEEGRVLCQRDAKLMEEKEEWVFYEENIEEMMAVLFSLSYLTKE